MAISVGREQAAAAGTSRIVSYATAALAAIGLTTLVVWFGWVSDDGLITFRYAANVLAGHGIVYNPGEYVQGYTHPLWMLLLVAVLVFTKNALLVAVALGGALTLAMAGAFGFTLARRTWDPMVAAAAILATGAVLATSESWLSFQTSGLENSLSHLLIALLILEIFREAPRAFAVSLWASLMVLTRLDLAPLVAPLGLMAIYEFRSRKGLPSLALGTVPLLAWLLFSLAYYGTIVPNTARAKVGVYPSLSTSAGLGLAYVRDWIHYEPGAAVAAVSMLAAGARLARHPLPLALAAGAVLDLVYIVAVGGDFMRGRFMMAFFVTACLFGSAAIVHARACQRSRRAVLAGSVIVVVTAMLFQALAPRQDRRIVQGIVNERLFYSGMTLSHYMNNGALETPVYAPRLPGDLRTYRQRCGEITIHSEVIGSLGYETRDVVEIIDIVGLTDRYIASLPNSFLIERVPRPGHPFKRIPLAYLARRGDVSVFDGWQDAVRAGDCSLRARAHALASSDALFDYSRPLP
jgi:arabinofuranosyltransferase